MNSSVRINDEIQYFMKFRKLIHKNIDLLIIDNIYNLSNCEIELINPNVFVAKIGYYEKDKFDWRKNWKKLLSRINININPWIYILNLIYKTKKIREKIFLRTGL